MAGHVSADHVVAPTGSRVQPGGAAAYAATAARVFSDDVAICTAVGQDYEYLHVLKEFPSSQVVVTKAKSTRFTIGYDEKWVAHYDVSAFGAARYLRASRMISAASGRSYVHLAPMPPAKVAKVVEGLRKVGGATIVMNSWDGYMKRRIDRKILRWLIPKVDYFIVNEKEVTMLAEVDLISAALRVLDPSHLIVTLGEFGAIYMREGRLELTPASGGMGGRIVDTTGAGDSWCGAFVGALSLGESVSSSILAGSIISALKCRGWNFERIRSLRFDSVGELVAYAVRLREGGQLTLGRYLRQ